MSYSSVVFMDKCKITAIEFKKLELCLQYFSNLHVSMIHGRKKNQVRLRRASKNRSLVAQRKVSA